MYVLHTVTVCST